MPPPPEGRNDYDSVLPSESRLRQGRVHQRWKSRSPASVGNSKERNAMRELGSGVERQTAERLFIQPELSPPRKRNRTGKDDGGEQAPVQELNNSKH
ncbi:hypothetical protein E4U53_005013 [Claviceps sorghi]|nr:hypothetical protein E4U53_005013 [Claviceps sorghi]